MAKLIYVETTVTGNAHIQEEIGKAWKWNSEIFCFRKVYRLLPTHLLPKTKNSKMQKRTTLHVHVVLNRCEIWFSLSNVGTTIDMGCWTHYWHFRDRTQFTILKKKPCQGTAQFLRLTWWILLGWINKGRRDGLDMKHAEKKYTILIGKFECNIIYKQPTKCTTCLWRILFTVFSSACTAFCSFFIYYGSD